MIQNEDETLLQTIRARLEREEKGDVRNIFYIDGFDERKEISAIISRFHPVNQPNLDKYGNKIENHE